MVILIDNYDSFTYNIVHALRSLGAEVTVLRNDQCAPEAVTESKPLAVILSPGPCAPEQAGICLPFLRHNAGANAVPVLGVCLGHQAIAEAYGGKVVRAVEPKHGKVSDIIRLDDAAVPLRRLPNRFRAARYHSLTAERSSLPDELTVTAETDDADRVIMALAHRTQPIWGVQFHPESYATEHGTAIFADFLEAVA